MGFFASWTQVYPSLRRFVGVHLRFSLGHAFLWGGGQHQPPMGSTGFSGSGTLRGNVASSEQFCLLLYDNDLSYFVLKSGRNHRLKGIFQTGRSRANDVGACAALSTNEYFPQLVRNGRTFVTRETKVMMNFERRSSARTFSLSVALSLSLSERVLQYPSASPSLVLLFSLSPALSLSLGFCLFLSLSLSLSDKRKQPFKLISSNDCLSFWCSYKDTHENTNSNQTHIEVYIGLEWLFVPHKSYETHVHR